ncbi:DUF3039 domain-containing protein [Microbacterium sp. NPDC091382]|uniref:DUF3039 domain-containing protein n=1 Tax=Microbacterium sp. NPDC091382 TaxID=3364210 RepID=UPI00382682C6
MAKLPTTPELAAACEVIARAKANPTEAGQILEELRLETVDSTLLEDANRGFASGAPSRHEEASRTYHGTVYEVRDHDGAGWRGAVIQDAESDPWLVYADRHNTFHATVASALKRDKGELDKGRIAGPAVDHLPTKLDVKVRENEEERLRDLHLRLDLVQGLREGLRQAFREGEAVTVATPVDHKAPTGSGQFEYTIKVEHDPPAEEHADAHNSTSEVTILVAMGVQPHRVYEMLIGCGAVYVQPDPQYRESVYTPSNEMRLDIVVTHAKLTQLISDADVDEASFPPSADRPDRLHWVRSTQHIEGLVTGSAVRSLCGGWFVATENEGAGLPVCDHCERIKPFAQEVLDQLRLRAHS